MKVPGIPFDQGRWPRGPLTPTAVVLHRTFGRWPGDYSIGKNGRGDQSIGFHFLIGKSQAVQFYDTAVKCNHAAGANSWAIGIEFEGTNADVLTDFQVHTGREVIADICAHHRIPVTYATSGPRRKINGCLPHLLVPGSDHTDLVTAADWERMFPTTPPPYIAPEEDDDMAAPRPYFIQCYSENPGVFYAFGNTKTGIASQQALQELQFISQVNGWDTTVHAVSADFFNSLGTVAA